MEKQKMIPEGSMTVGEVAKKMGVSVRTLQYYDREGLASPSSVSKGGRRLYTDKDIVRLHQILSLKHLGFSLNDIRDRLILLDTPEEVAGVLKEQAEVIRMQIERLKESLREIEALREEVLQMQTVDFKKYADIIVNLQMKNEYYWLIKYFDEPMMEHIRKRFDQKSGIVFMQRFVKLQKRAIQLLCEGVSPQSEKGQRFAKEYWDMVLKFTGGDPTMLTKLIELGQSSSINSEWWEKQVQANAFIEPALGCYLANCGQNSFEEQLEQ